MSDTPNARLRARNASYSPADTAISICFSFDRLPVTAVTWAVIPERITLKPPVLEVLMFSEELFKTMKVRPLVFVIATIVLLVASSYAKHEKMPLPSQVMTAKTIYIDNRSGDADIGDKAYDELRKWGRFQIVDSAEKADVVLLLSASKYISGYSSDSYHNTRGSVDSSGNIEAHTSGNSSSDAIVSGQTYVTIVDPKSGTPLWSDARAWGRKSATRGLIKELRERMEQQEAGK